MQGPPPPLNHCPQLSLPPRRLRPATSRLLIPIAAYVSHTSCRCVCALHNNARLFAHRGKRIHQHLICAQARRHMQTRHTPSSSLQGSLTKQRRRGARAKHLAARNTAAHVGGHLQSHSARMPRWRRHWWQRKPRCRVDGYEESNGHAQHGGLVSFQLAREMASQMLFFFSGPEINRG